MEYLPTFAQHKSPSCVGKYTIIWDIDIIMGFSINSWKTENNMDDDWGYPRDFGKLQFFCGGRIPWSQSM
jgi:hypothetical protein